MGYTLESVAKHTPGFPRRYHIAGLFSRNMLLRHLEPRPQPPHSTYVSGGNKLKWALDTSDLSVTTTKPSEA